MGGVPQFGTHVLCDMDMGRLNTTIKQHGADIY